jgi:hypothetical protein
MKQIQDILINNNLSPTIKLENDLFEFTKDIAIGFADYIANHRLDFQSTTVIGKFIGLDFKYYTTEQLFNEYLNTLK